MPSHSKIILLHGWSIEPLHDQKWQPFRNALTALDIDSELLKIPGLSAPLNQEWSLSDYMHWLEHELVGADDVILLGHSFGGQLAVRYAALHPQQIQKLILVDSSGIRDHNILPTVKRFGFKVAAKIGKFFFHQEAFRKILYRLAREKDYQNAPPLLRRTMSNILDEEILEDLPHIVCPTLLVWGSKDMVTPITLARIFQETIPNAQLECIENARHSPQYTHTEKVAELVAEFVKVRTP